MTPAAPQAPPATAGAPPPSRLRVATVLLVAFTLLVAFLVVSISYALAREYGDVLADDAGVAVRALRDWAPGILLVTVLGSFAVLTARRSRGRGVLSLVAVAAVVLTLVGVPAVAVVGVHRKYEEMPRVPACTDGFSSGPAVPVVRAAQDAFDELAHPGPFSGGGESGLDGCASELMVRADIDVVAAYAELLPAAGWRLDAAEPDHVEATRAGQRFTASRDGKRGWWVRIGPAGAVR